MFPLQIGVDYPFVTIVPLLWLPLPAAVPFGWCGDYPRLVPFCSCAWNAGTVQEVFWCSVVPRLTVYRLPFTLRCSRAATACVRAATGAGSPARLPPVRFALLRCGCRVRSHLPILLLHSQSVDTAAGC
ncbi:hypothetical protein AVEN_87779-1 [Araneus ventricosus]|uniref:Uncharacterized protein n=1 Tax=Araneus ventricosus TaxID=182803 RepID=A0A4Y2A7I9_ARAVE|nr:hypothetical protein AVEN_87779-1 [Araneus ventricosus]